MTKDEFQKLAREEAEKYANAGTDMKSRIMKIAFASGAFFGFDQGISAILAITEQEGDSARAWSIKRKLAEIEEEAK